MAQKQTTNGKKQRQAQPPKLFAYHVAERGEKKFWTRIGAAWDHKDGEGYTLQLDLVPVDGGRIVLRPPQAENEEAGDAQDAGEAGEAEDTEEAED